MKRTVKIILIVISPFLVAFIGFGIFLYTASVERKSFQHDDHFVTVFTEEIGSFNSRFGVFIVPRFKSVLFMLNLYDYIEMIESDCKLIAINAETLKIYIPPNKVFIHQDGQRYEIEENRIVYLYDFSGFEHVDVYYGDDNIKKEFLNDTTRYWVKEDT